MVGMKINYLKRVLLQRRHSLVAESRRAEGLLRTLQVRGQ
jgi:hypothetical protein